MFFFKKNSEYGGGRKKHLYFIIYRAVTLNILASFTHNSHKQLDLVLKGWTQHSVGNLERIAEN